MTDTDVREPPRQSRNVGRYANVFRVGFNAFEMVIEFGEQFSDLEGPRLHTRVVTNPVFARGLVDSLNEALANYASTYSADPRTAAHAAGVPPNQEDERCP
jgi:uncharacterized protein DUF3467